MPFGLPLKDGRGTTFHLIFLLLIIFVAPLSAQVTNPPDSLLRKITSVQDSSRSGQIDSPIKPASVGLSKPVEYTYKRMITRTGDQGRITQLIGDATVKFGKVTITAGKITIRWNDNLLIAESLPDTSNAVGWPDSLVVKKTGIPTFSDGGEPMSGDRMEFNFKTEKGRVVRGRTKFQRGYYQGGVVKRVDPSVFNVANGMYSTCDKEEPHFHFRGKKMKVIVNDKVIAKPVIFFIGKIPVAIFPFAMFPTNETGRSSGLILPQFGSSPVEGRYLRNLGYYWATNDYMDIRFTLDFFEKTGILFRGNLNYALRYNFTGGISGSYTRKNFAGTKQRRWNLDIRHSHTIDANTRFSVNASFVSNNTFFKEFSSNRSQRLNRQLRSNATFNKSWSQNKNSLSLNLSQTKDLETGSQTTTLPQLRFSRSQSALIPAKEGASIDKQKWYNFIRYSYQGFMVNTVRKDSSNDKDADIDRRFEHDLRLSFTNPKKIFGWLSFNQSFNYDEDWFDRKQTFTLVDSTNRFESADDKGFSARRVFQYSAGASTNLFGTFNTKIGQIQAIRHKMTPSISFSFRPDFSNPFWGYYQEVEDTTGQKVRLDKFRGTP
ncbi:MAG: putative LPS assembly protein LptD, partial [bacterium]